MVRLSTAATALSALASLSLFVNNLTEAANVRGSASQETREAQEVITLSEIYDESLVSTTAPQNNPPSTGEGTSPSGACNTREYVDVVIIGAGMAGIKAAATLQAEDPNLSYVILESTERVGGRVRSRPFGVQGNTRTIEDGANWLLNFKDNPMLQLAQATQLVTPINDYSDYKTYTETVSPSLLHYRLCFVVVSSSSFANQTFFLLDRQGTPIDETLLSQENERFVEAWEAAIEEADNQWTPDHETYPDQGVRALLAQQGWQIGPGAVGNLDYTIEWFLIDFE